MWSMFSSTICRETESFYLKSSNKTIPYFSPCFYFWLTNLELLLSKNSNVVDIRFLSNHCDVVNILLHHLQRDRELLLRIHFLLFSMFIFLVDKPSGFHTLARCPQPGSLSPDSDDCVHICDLGMKQLDKVWQRNAPNQKP